MAGFGPGAKAAQEIICEDRKNTGEDVLKQLSVPRAR
jgi:hypothetical protein